MRIGLYIELSEYQALKQNTYCGCSCADHTLYNKVMPKRAQGRFKMAFDQPFDDRPGRIWYDGEMVPWQDATLHVLSHALHYASAVFEGERLYDGRIFKLTEHTERLFHSANRLDMKIPYSVANIDDACNAVVADLGIKDGYVRPIAWRGSELMGVSAQQTKIHVAVAVWEWPAYFTPEARMEGIRMEWSKWKRHLCNE